MAKVEKEVREYIKGLIEKGINKKEASEELQFKFNKMSKSMLNVAYCKVKEEVEEEKAAKQIVDIIGGAEKENKPLRADKDTKDTKEEKKAKKEKIETKEIDKKQVMETKKEVGKEMSKSKLKVLSMTLEGNNGKYKVCENGVELTNAGMMMSFKNIEELDKFTEEFREVFGMMK